MDGMEDTRMDQFFYPNACYVCEAYGKNIDLKRCSNCKMIAYCSRKHQKIHWPAHRELCQVLTDILRVNGSLYGSRDNLENIEESWLNAKIRLITLVQEKLGRVVSCHETEILCSPRCCIICHETDREKLQDCPDCPYASFCLQHLPVDNEHSVECKTLKLCIQTNNVQISFVDDFVLENYSKCIPKTMEEAISLNKPPPRSIKPKEFSNLIVADQISRVYTFLWSFLKLSREKSEKLTIHVVGADYTEKYTIHYWQRLFHHIEPLKDLTVVFIGPEQEDDSDKVYYVNYGRRLSIQYARELYADFVAGHYFTKPDYVIGYNVGIHVCNLEDDTWAQSLKVVSRLGCPFSFTSYFDYESRLDRERINLIFGKEVEFLWNGKNPFSGWKPMRNSLKDAIFYQNMFLTIYEKLG